MRYSSSGKFYLQIPANEAVRLFTPEGERAWVPEWNPHYATGEPSEAPGTVFTTRTHGSSTIWTIVEIDRSAGSATYARVTPDHHAGLVRVQCADTQAGRCSVTVSYDMSLLGEEHSSGFDAYEPAQVKEMLRGWAEAIGAYLADQDT